MKAIMTAIVLLVAGVLTTLTCPAQTTIGFNYDASGNREIREVVSSRSAAVSSNYLIIDPKFRSVNSQIGKQKVKFRIDAGENLLQVNFPWLGHRETIIQITDLHGKQLLHQSSTSSKNSISISDYPPGYYRLTISIGEEKKEWEIVRE